MLQRLFIIEYGSARLVLRELPLEGWFFASGLFVIGIAMALANLLLTAVTAVVVGTYYGATAAIQDVVFDKTVGTLTVHRYGLLERRILSSMPLETVVMAYLYEDGDWSQAFLILADDELGLSTLSRWGKPWKRTITMTVNDFLEIDNNKIEERLGHLVRPKSQEDKTDGLHK